MDCVGPHCGNGAGPVGCGGGGTNSLRSASGLSGQPRPSSGSSGPIYEATGKVTLPTGSKLVLTKLTINTCIDTEPIAANGTFKVGVLGDGLSSAFVEDSSGDAIMAGYVDPSKDGSPWAAGKGTVNTPTTALYLLFYSCGGFTLPPGDTVATLASLAKLSQIPTLASAISARIVANPLALVDKDSNVVAAVAAATQAIEKAAGAGRAVPPAQQITQTITVRVKKPSVQGALALVTPGQQDGITPMITSTDTGATLSFQNTYRRRCAAFAYETAIETQSDTSPQAITPVPMVTTKTGFYPAAYTTLGEPQPTVPAFTIAPANALHGVVGSVVDLIMHYGAFTPVTTDGMNLVVDPTLKETDFTIVVLGPSENADNFDQTDLKPLSKYIPDWQNTIGALTLTTTALDVLIPLAYSVPGAENFGPEFGQFTSPVLGDAMNAAASLPDTVASYKSGDEKGFADSCYQNLADSGSWRDNLVKNFMTEFYKGYSATPTQAQIEKIDSYCEEGGKLLAVADYVLLAADVTAIVWAAYHTNPADVWTAKIDVGKCGAPPAFDHQPGIRAGDQQG